MKCPDCKSEMKDVKSFPRGEIIYGGRNYCDVLWQCPNCKTIAFS